MWNPKRRPFKANRRKAFTVPFWLTLLFLALLAAVGAAVPAAAQEVVTDDEVNEVAREVYCPVCENTPLDVCETRACADWRELIRTKLGEGQTKQEIFDYFATQYGDRVLATPPKEGFNLILWIWPIFALVVGVIFFGRYLRALREESGEAAIPAAAEGSTADNQPAEDDYVARIEKELAER